MSVPVAGLRWAFVLGLGLSLSACWRPGSVRSVEAWLTAYQNGDAAEVEAHTAEGDRALLRQGLAQGEFSSSSTVALALPPRPIDFEILELEKIDNSGPVARHIVATRLRVKNPLPFSSEKIGQQLENFPRTRPRRRRFLVLEESPGQWRVKLDLQRVLARSRHALAFQDALFRGDYQKAQTLIDAVPGPPDDGNALSKQDRLRESMEADLLKKQKADKKGDTQPIDRGK
jgi:hypothetical protein